MKKPFIFLILTLVLIVSLISFVESGGYEVPLTRGQVCLKSGCTMEGDINMDNNSIYNAQWINATYTNITINYTQLSDEHWVNETLEIGNQTFAQTVDGEDIELRLETDTNERAYIYYMESDSGILGFRAWYDGHGGGTYKIDAIDGTGTIVPKIEIDRDDYDFDFFVNEDLNDNNITNVQCLELDNNVICSWDNINTSIGDTNISEGTGEHWWNETDVESSDFTTTGNLEVGNANITGTTTLNNITCPDGTCEIDSSVNLSTNNFTAQYINEWDWTNKTDSGNTRTWVWII